MDIFEFDISELIPKVSAQPTDTAAQPTFGTLDISGGGTSIASVSLTADSTAVAVGQTFEVDIDIATGSFTVKEYRIVIDFDTTRLSVVDADTTTSGTQIDFLDTVFAVDPGNNFVSASGRITLVAQTPSSNALQINRTVARITFQVQDTGTTTIEPVSGIEGTQLINENGIAIASSLNSLTVSASAQSSTTSSSATTGSTSSAASSSSQSVTTIPETALGDDILSISPLLIGLLLLWLGVSLRRERQKTNE
jgi:hypothetical protein